MSAEELAKLAQNPVGNLISVPFQNNTNFNVGPQNGTQNVLNIQPVIPITVNEDWNIITRTIMPVIWQPALVPGAGDRTFGLGDTSSRPSCRRASRARRADLGRRPDRAAADQHQRSRQQELGPRAVGRGAAARARLPLGLRRAGEQRLVAVQRQRRRGLQQRLDPAFRELQLRGRLLPHQRADPHGRLEGRQRPAVDGAAGRRRRQDLPPRQAAGEHPAAAPTTTSCTRTSAPTGSCGRRCS